jgi:hypothetical protein
MTRFHTTLAWVLFILATGGAIALAQDGKDAKPAASKPAAGAPAPVLFTGKSTNANLQEALNDALQKAQLAVTKNVADARFNFRVDTIQGTRGGFAGTNEISVTIRIVD